MAAEPQLYPTSDIHLILEDGHSPMQVNIRERWSYDLDLLGAGVRFVDFEDDIVSISYARGVITFSPVGFGETIGRIVYREWEILARVRVHRSIRHIWLANDGISVYEGNADYVVSVFAQFADGTIGDITAHPYYDLSVSPNGRNHLAFVPGDRGRLRGLLHSEQHFSINLTYKTIQDSIIAYVEPGLAEESRPILECIYGASSGGAIEVNAKKNILFLADGFTEEDRANFSELVLKAIDNLFEFKAHAPFHLLKESFNMWQAFDPPPEAEAGMTLGRPIFTPASPYIKGKNIQDSAAFLFSDLTEEPIPDGAYTTTIPFSLGRIDDRGEVTEVDYETQFIGIPTPLKNNPSNPAEAALAWDALGFESDDAPDYGSDGYVSQEFIDRWLAKYSEVNSQGEPNIALMRTKNSRLGLIIDYRYGENDFYKWDAENMRPLNSWYPKEERPDIHLDYRRLSHHKHRDINSLNAYIRSLAVNEEKHDPIPGLSRRWQVSNHIEKTEAGQDFDLVVVILNCGFAIGANAHGIIYIGLDSDDCKLRNVSPAGPIPNYSYDPNLIYDLPIGDVKVLRNGVRFFEFCAVLAHELGHSFNLSDEYEGNGAAKESQYKEFDLSANLISPATLFENGQLDITKVKWTRWHRMQYAAPVVEVETVSSAIIGCKVSSNDFFKFWDKAYYQPKSEERTEFYLRTVNIIPDTPGESLHIIGPLRVESMRIPDTIEVSGPLRDQLTNRSISIRLLRDILNKESGLIIYIPEYDERNGAFSLQNIFHKEVYDFLLNEKRPFYSKPFKLDDNGNPTEKKNCESNPALFPTVQSVNGEEQSVMPDFPTYSPDYQAFVNGMYEGGSTHNCNVYRVSYACKMRSHFPSANAWGFASIHSKLGEEAVKEFNAALSEETAERKREIDELETQIKEVDNEEERASLQELLLKKKTFRYNSPESWNRGVRWKYYVARSYNRYAPFCDVCSYHLVNTLAPSFLQDLRVRADKM